MPSPFAPTFASAAASTNGDNSGSRRDNAGSSEWSRRNVNGATQTFRRPSLATTPSQTRETGTASASATTPGGVYIPPHLSAANSTTSRNPPSGDMRYSKEQLLNIFQTLKETSALDTNLEDIFAGTWDPLDSKTGLGDQGAAGDGKDQTPGPEVCWNYAVNPEPFGLTNLTEEEKQLFSSSVNSPIKPQQNITKESTGVGVIGRKASLSTYSNTPGASRPGTRRRETSDSFMGNGPLSPVEGKTFFRTESNTATPPPALLRRRTDYKEEETTPTSKENQEPEDTPEPQPPLPGLRRAATGPLSAGGNPLSASPWSAGGQGSAFGSMGTFGSFAIGATGTPSESNDKRPGFGSARGSSRFKDILQSKASAEDVSQLAKDKGLFGALENLPEEDVGPRQARLRDELKTRPGRSETNPYEDDPMRTGSAALGGSQDPGPAAPGIEQMGMSAFGPHQSIGTRDFSHDDPYQQTPYGRAHNPHEPMSPTNTNPYQSPHGRLEDEQDTNDSASQASGLPHFGGAAPRRNMYPSTDEGRHSASGLRSVSGFGGLPGFGGLGGNPMWSAAGIGSGKPAMDRGITSAFGDPVFGPLSELQSPGGLGGGFGGFGSAGRSSRLGAMLPAAMQEHVRGDSRNEARSYDSRPESAQQHPLRDPFEVASRRHDDFARGSGVFDDSPSMRSVEEPGNGQYGLPGSGPPTSSVAISGAGPQTAGPRAGGSDNYQSGHGLSQSSGSSSSNQLPAAQQRQMVMPDRMRWIYRDPQGNTQGPWSGLEMHDWFKAGFFTAELQVKKLEDAEFEPLAQLVRRIGNSREPFLVPQIGVPHGPPTSGPGNTWANPAIPPTSGTTQPPFANSFPSFGTTLTAEQQNALERRKQEEQYLMARQKEHLAQQQMAMKMQMQNGMHSLQHHSSAHSLQSQPSFGSITSPTGYQPSPIQPMMQPQQPAPFTQHAGPVGGPAFGREDDVQNMMERLSFSQRAGLPFASAPLGPPPTEAGPSSQPVNTMLQDRARLQQQQQQADMRGHQEAFLGPQGRNERLEEFRSLRGQADIPAGRLGPDEPRQQPIGAPRPASEQPVPLASAKLPAPIGHPSAIAKPEPESLSLAQQVQIAAASQQAAAAEESEWAKKDTPIEHPPVSISPLPAPAAQRNRQHVADALAAESRSATQTPIETPVASVAPWAERTVEHPKGPSLKEIQEAEAKNAAVQEEVARRAQAEQERLALAQSQAPVPAPGLPSTSTWGSAASPGTPGSQTTSVWAKQTPAKVGAGASTAPKKTLAQIQKEEESRKQRAAAAQVVANAQNAANSAAAAVGKRYAELASKAAPAVPTSSGGAWTTVGSGGKAKAPPAVVATPQPVSRTVSTSNTPKTRPAVQTARSTTLPNQSKANEEFTKWIKGVLGKGLNAGINLDNFVQDLLQLPPEIEIISDSVYASSQILDGRRFAEEFVRRRKLADKGVIESAAGAQPMMGIGAGADTKGAGGAGGGWSEVAKKGPANVTAAKEEGTAQFKVVPTKKKGKR
ncbi:GYF domain containing protein [Cladophialophora carrionii]|uniref:GYF domain containing protein n=1 Tax=Cladophialophora carrionii TaxID=86049 RepID=A0A1C1C6T5_9EURO|nr:GYF domain containing protein [Cladophialophora carrionii]